MHLKALCGVGLAALLTCASINPALAQSADTSSQQGAVVWNDAPAAPKRKTLEFVRAVLQIPAQEPVGRISGSMECKGGGAPIHVTQSGDMSPDDFRHPFNDALAAAGYGAGGDSLFGEVGATEANLKVAAAITEVHIDACLKGFLGPDEYASTTEITVQWQVLDPIERKVTRYTSRGVAKVRTKAPLTPAMLQYGIMPKLDTMVGLRAAFGEATRALLDTPEFQQISTVSSEEQANVDQLAQTPAAVTSIAGVRLSTRPFQERFKDIQAQVVTIRSSGGSGSGFYIADGLLLTNHHVAAKGASVKVRFLSGKEVMGLVVTSNARRDVALIRTENVDLVGLPLRTDIPDPGSQVYVIGSPLGQQFEGSVSSGVVSSVRVLEHNHNRFIQSDAVINGGNSGGPMLDDKGNVIGISDLSKVENGVGIGINFFIPIGEALASVGVIVQAPEPAKATKVTAKKKAAP